MELLGKHNVSRRELRRQDRRDSILTVAAQSFFEHGYAGTTMSGIAAALGGSKGTLWSYFSSKEELFTAVADQKTADYRARLGAILETPAESLEVKLKRVCTSILEKVTSAESIALQRLIAAEAGRSPELGTIFYNRGPGKTHRMLAEFLEREMDAGHLRRDDPLRAARALASLCVYPYQHQLLWRVVETTDAADMAAEIEQAVDIFLRAYAPA